jgi:hypothetical protein
MSAKALLSASVSAGPAVYVEDVFSTYLYTGTGAAQTITNGIDLSGEGGLIYYKQRDGSWYPTMVDTVRGLNNRSFTHLTDPGDTGGNFTALSNGYQINDSNAIQNGIGLKYASWTFRKAEKFFDVVTFTAAAGAYSATVNHSLGSTPGCIIVKCTSSGGAVGDWNVWHRSLASDKALVLNSSSAQNAPGTNWITANSTSFSVNGSLPTDNATYVAYLFAHDAGGFGDAGTDSVVSCGSYTNNSSQAVEVNLGWEPQWVLIKRADGSGDWIVADMMRGIAVTQSDTGGGTGPSLSANSANAENATGAAVKPTSTGFKVQYNVTTNQNSAATTGTVTYIYIAIRRGPMKTPTVGTEVFKVNTRTGTGSNTSVTEIGFTPDLVAAKVRTTADLNWGTYWYDRLRGNFKHLASSSTNDEGGVSNGYALAGTAQETADIVQIASINTSGDTLVDWFFRRAPGFFDVVAYTGTGSARTVAHNLGVAPELIITKRRDAAEDWWSYHSALGATQTIRLQADFTAATTSLTWDDTSPTSSVFTLSNYVWVNASGGTYIAYLFATAPGVSKVGSYTGTGTTLSIDCGFTAGARFVLIKRTDSTGDWYVWDTARGIISGNDPYLRLNSTAAEVTNTDYIDPLSSGFQVSSTAPAAINASGGTYIFLAIA